MPIEANNKRFSEYIAKRMEAKLKAATKALEYCGNKGVAEMRQKGRYNDYTDRTGNLRSSTGFAVVREGRFVAGSAFRKVKDGDKGTHEGKKRVTALSSQLLPNEMGLVITAGMEYGKFLEASGKRNVIGTTKKLVAKEAKERLKKIGFTISE